MSGQRLAYGYLSESSGQLIRSNQRDEHTSGFNPTGRCQRGAEKVKAFATGRTPFQFASVFLAHKAYYFGVLRFVYDYLRRGFSYFKLGADFLDLRGLVFALRDHRLHFTLEFTDACLRRLELLVSVE